MALLLGTVTRYDYFVQKFLIHAQIDINDAAVTHGDFLGSEANSRKYQCGVSARSVDRVLAIRVSGGTRIGILDDDRHARYGGVVFGRSDRTRDGAVLGERKQWKCSQHP